ncbi:AMP-binding protein [Terasakiella pusilla]|uniref:AMP-binding protein n=1 Tax=Terasakiella pusilla TaxID=64973 RepID=UPI00068F39DB|nr:AMP-binding protein [Terasakiella pusilla]
MNPAPLVRVLAQHAKEKTQEIAFIFLRDGERDAVTITYAELDKRAKIIASSILTKMPEAKRALLMHPPGVEFVAALCGCFYAGVAAVPCYPPTLKMNSRANDRLLRMAEDAQASLGLMDTTNAAKVTAYLTNAPIRLMETNVLTEETTSQWPVVDASETALIQYTSGSTGVPKGVVISHANLMANLSSIQQAFDLTAQSRVVSWLPPYHDMGLIGGILSALYSGYVLIMMEPKHFLQKPIRWLWAIERYKADTSGAPSFAYDLCVEKTTSQEIEALNLSSWKLAFCGAETVRANSLRDFSTTFAPANFSKTALFATYGLAEITLMATAPGKGQGTHVVSFDPALLEQGYGVPARDPSSGRDLTSCGAAGEGTSLCIIDPQRNVRCEEGQIGEIWLAGPSVAQGYWGQEKSSQDVFQIPLEGSKEKWLRTGDLGFLWKGELFVSGRQKDLLIIRGKNFFPPDLEEVVSTCHPALALNGCAAFAVDTGEEERFILAAEVRREARRTVDVARVTQAIRSTLSEMFDISAHDIVFLRPHALPRTTSGKISRTKCREDYLHQKWIALKHVIKPGETKFSADRDAFTIQVFTCLARLLGVEEYTLDEQQTLGDLGIDSLKRVELSLTLESLLDCPLNPELFDTGLRLDELVARLRACQGDAKPVTPLSLKEAGDLPLSFPLTPLQHGFLNANLTEADQFAETIYLRTPRGVDVQVLQDILDDLDHRFDGLRMRFGLEKGRWRQTYGALGTAFSFERLDVSGLTPQDMRAKRQDMVDLLKSGIDIAKGPIAKAVLFDRGPFETGILGLSIHHLVVDAISISIIVTTLAEFYEQAVSGKYLAAVSKPVFGPWLNQMGRYANQMGHQELGYWQKVCAPAGKGATDQRRPADEEPKWKIALPKSLSLEETRRFFTRYPDAGQRQDVLVAALASVWCEVTQDDHALIALEHHGRRGFDDGGAAPWNGVGWFVYRYPVRISATTNALPSAWLQATQEAIAKTPRHGMGYGLLAYVCQDNTIQSAMKKLRRPRLKVTYRGNVDAGFRKGAVFSYIGREGDTTCYLKALEKVDEHYDLELQGTQNKGRLNLTFQYASHAMDEDLLNEMKEKLIIYLKGLTSK